MLRSALTSRHPATGDGTEAGPSAPPPVQFAQAPPSAYLPIVFTNTSAASCTLDGDPVVEFVGDGSGTTIGSAATHGTTVAPTLTTIAPGKAAGTTVRITETPSSSRRPPTRRARRRGC